MADLPFRSGRVFMHKNEMDHAMLIQKIQYIGDDYCVIKVEHIGLGYEGKPYLMPGPKRYRIKTKDYVDYHEVLEQDLYKPRTRPGNPSLNCDTVGILKDMVIPDSPGEREE